MPRDSSTLSEVLDGGVALYRRSLIGSLPLSLLAVLLGQLPSVYLITTRQALALDESKDAIWWSLMLLSAIGTLWCWLAIMLRQRAALVTPAEAPSALADWLTALRCLPSAFVTLLVGALLIALGLLLLAVPGIYLLVAFWPALALVVFESAGPRAALDGALQLARGAWRHLAITLLVVVMTLLGLFVIGGLVGLVFVQVLQPDAPGGASWVTTLVTGVLSAAFQPLFIAFGLAAYADLEQRRRQASSSASNSA